MEKVSEFRRPTGILFVGTENLRPGTVDNIQATGLLRADFAADIDEALNMLRREAYRFRAIVVSEEISKGTEQGELEKLIATHSFGPSQTCRPIRCSSARELDRT